AYARNAEDEAPAPAFAGEERINSNIGRRRPVGGKEDRDLKVASVPGAAGDSGHHSWRTAGDARRTGGIGFEQSLVCSGEGFEQREKSFLLVLDRCRQRCF